MIALLHDAVFVKALEVLFILHADHEQNCSTNAVRAVGSSHVDPFSAIAAGIASSALRELDRNVFVYDPAFVSTAACASSISFLDGDRGILRYRGYPIEQLAEQSTYLEVAYLLIHPVKRPPRTTRRPTLPGLR